jgi:hypothetical protein
MVHRNAEIVDKTMQNFKTKIGKEYSIKGNIKYYNHIYFTVSGKLVIFICTRSTESMGLHF